MLPLEWYRNFLAIYRAGSVSGAARARALTQPAVSQQLSALESAIGVPLFERTAKGMVPTARGEALYVQVFESLDRLERVSRALQPKRDPNPTIRLGTTPEYFHQFALPRLAPLGYPMAVSLGSDRDLLTQVETGALDVAVTTLKPSGRTLQHRYVGVRRYVLIGSMGAEGPREGPPSRQLGTWLNSQPWVSYSEERPVTRRFFQQSLECRFEAKVSLVVPDLRAVVRAVELGVGISIVPEFACRRGLDEGRLRELFPIADSIPSEPWFLAYRDLDSDREQVHRISQALAER